MNLFDQFAEWTDTTAQYPVTAPQGYCSEPSYLALGIADEAGELADSMPGEERLKEAGDVLWYCSRYATKVLGIPFSVIVEEAKEKVEPSRNAIKHAGIICGVEKKRIRDGHAWDDDKRNEKHLNARSALIRVVSWVMWELASCDYYIEQAINANMAKLTGRLEAGTIHGDGDNR
jgi:NTP pyrophosphatase (non-canonical NTP hydrolase)